MPASASKSTDRASAPWRRRTRSGEPEMAAQHHAPARRSGRRRRAGRTSRACRSVRGRASGRARRTRSCRSCPAARTGSPARWQGRRSRHPRTRIEGLEGGHVGRAPVVTDCRVAVVAGDDPAHAVARVTERRSTGRPWSARRPRSGSGTAASPIDRPPTGASRSGGRGRPAVETMNPAGTRSGRRSGACVVGMPNQIRCASPSPSDPAAAGSAVVWVMPSGSKTSDLHRVRVGLAGDRFDDATQDDIVRIGIRVAGAGRARRLDRRERGDLVG